MYIHVYVCIDLYGFLVRIIYIRITASCNTFRISSHFCIMFSIFLEQLHIRYGMICQFQIPKNPGWFESQIEEGWM